jgi:hypothetical protein
LDLATSLKMEEVEEEDEADDDQEEEDRLDVVGLDDARDQSPGT